MPGKHAFNPSTWKLDLYEFEAGLLYRVSSRIAKAAERNSFSTNKQTDKHPQIPQNKQIR